MKCPKCQFENREGVKFCQECGAKFEFECPACKSNIPLSSKFCSECGYDLKLSNDFSDKTSETDCQPHLSSAEISLSKVAPIIGERKHVTALFSDLIGYTTMSERLDPEDVKDITTHIFDEISKIVTKYDGFIEKFVGDAVMALFGAKEAHEDDPVRAIKAAKEIHNAVKILSPKYEKKIKQPLSLHTGINTGLVVTGDLNLKMGTHGVAGDTINVASRLSSIGKTDEIIVGLNTFCQAEGYFEFQELEPAAIKGKSASIRIFKVLKAKEKPAKIHRLHGMRAGLTGRRIEINKLTEATQVLTKEKTGFVISISGSAGTGKSRLLEEFRSNLDLEKIQWMEGHAYQYSQNIPYHPLIDLLGRALQIKEGDAPQIVKEKVESGVASLIGKETNLLPYIGSLFSIEYPEIDEVSPEFWKKQLQKAVQMALATLSQRAPLIICFEDLHWADPSFLELIRLILVDLRFPIFFLCTYRPIISLFTSHQISQMVVAYHEIMLRDLSPTESQVMVESLLKAESIPTPLQQFVHEKIEGNPFYIEEVVNSLIELGILIKDNGGWKVIRPITEADVSSTINGVISSRLDRLEKKSKRILQEASVIGRSFLYDILKRATYLESQVDRCLSDLERLDLIKTRAIKPDLEYIFKHALTQEVVYSGVLKKERQKIHDRIGFVIEQLFHDKLAEFYEALAFHFKNAQNIDKAVNYLAKSGKKCIKRYAVNEADQFYEQAYKIMLKCETKSQDKKNLLVDTIIEWAFVLYYMGDFKKLYSLLETHLELAESIDDKSRLGMYYAWYGFTMCNRNLMGQSYKWLKKALKTGEEIDDQIIIGYACTWLSWVCSPFGRPNEAITFGERAQAIAEKIKDSQYLYFKSLGGLAMAYYLKGDSKKVIELGKRLNEFGQKNSNIRSECMGIGFIGAGYEVAGYLSKANSYRENSVQIAADPYYAEFTRAFLGMTYVLDGQIDKAENAFEKGLNFSQKLGVEVVGALSEIFMGLIHITKGRISYGLNAIKKSQQSCLNNQNNLFYYISEYVLGKIYSEIANPSGSMQISTMLKNLGFLVKNVPLASKKAEYHFNKAIETARKIGANGYLGLTYFDLGVLHNVKKRKDEANECISEAVKLFEQCGADVYLKKAKEVLASLA
jgi:class 3 adenylate cyclase/tetratricopeptide (TPR) repeat protein